MTLFDILVDCIILYVVISLLIGQMIISHAVIYELKNGPKIISALVLIPYFFWVSLWWPRIFYKFLRKEPW